MLLRAWPSGHTPHRLAHFYGLAWAIQACMVLVALFHMANVGARILERGADPTRTPPSVFGVFASQLLGLMLVVLRMRHFMFEVLHFFAQEKLEHGAQNNDQPQTHKVFEFGIDHRFDNVLTNHELKADQGVSTQRQPHLRHRVLPYKNAVEVLQKSNHRTRGDERDADASQGERDGLDDFV